MAIIRTIKCPNGATVHIDDTYLPKTVEEREKRRAEAWAVAYQIAARHMEDEQKKKEGKHDAL